MNNRKYALFLLAADIIGFILAYVLSIIILDFIGVTTNESNKTKNLAFYILMVFFADVYFISRAHYRLIVPWWEQVKHILKFCLFSLFISVVYYIVTSAYSSLLFALSSVLIFIILLLSRQLMRYYLIRKNSWHRPTVIIGGVENVIETLFAIKSEAFIPYDIKNIAVPSATDEQKQKIYDVHSVEVNTEIPHFSQGELVIVCPDDRRELRMSTLANDIEDAGAVLSVVPPIEGFSYYGLQPHYLFGYNIVFLHPTVQLNSLLNRIIKSSIDRLGALIAFFVLLPVFIWVAIKVKADGGNIFYGHKRLGKNGKMFKCWKFRSMVMNSQEILDELLANNLEARREWETDFKLKDDPRITKIGNFIRRTSLDELPQLFNVMMGQMSLVGPRPIVKDEAKYYGDKIEKYFALKPGMTGLWQVSGRNDISYDMRVYFDSWYARHWSVWTDIVIVIKTVFVVLFKRGAY